MQAGKPFYVSVFIVVSIQVATIVFIYLDNRNGFRGEYCNLEQVLAVDGTSRTYIQRVVIVKNGAYKFKEQPGIRKTVTPEVQETPIDADIRHKIENEFR